MDIDVHISLLAILSESIFPVDLLPQWSVVLTELKNLSFV